MMSLQNMEIYANKSAQMKLTEYEMLAYEQICMTIKTQMKFIDLQINKNIIDFEKQNPPKEED